MIFTGWPRTNIPVGKIDAKGTTFTIASDGETVRPCEVFMPRFLIGILVVLYIPNPMLAKQQNPPARPRVTFEEVLRREDADKNGKVTKSEFKGPPRLFERFDRNGGYSRGLEH